MALHFSSTIKNNRATQIVNAAGNGAKLRLYTGPQPSPGGSITTQVLVAEFTLGSPFGTVSNGVLTVNGLPSTVDAAASGEITWFRIVTSGGTWVMDGTAGGAGTDLLVSSPTVVSGQPVRVLSYTITEAN